MSPRSACLAALALVGACASAPPTRFEKGSTRSRARADFEQARADLQGKPWPDALEELTVRFGRPWPGYAEAAESRQTWWAIPEARACLTLGAAEVSGKTALTVTSIEEDGGKDYQHCLEIADSRFLRSSRK